MPYMRGSIKHGGNPKCVYHQNADGSLGGKIGCSKTVAGAKEYLKAKYAHMPASEKKGK